MGNQKRDRILIEIAKAEHKAKELRTAMRQLARIAAKLNRNERDMQIYEQMLQIIRRYDLVVPDEWQCLAW